MGLFEPLPVGTYEEIPLPETSLSSIPHFPSPRPHMRWEQAFLEMGAAKWTKPGILSHLSWLHAYYRRVGKNRLDQRHFWAGVSRTSLGRKSRGYRSLSTCCMLVYGWSQRPAFFGPLHQDSCGRRRRLHPLPLSRSSIRCSGRCQKH